VTLDANVPLDATMTSAGRSRAARYLRLYPRAWRERYGDELEAVLETDGLGMRSRLDLIRGAVDARLHPAVPSPLPVVAALSASAFAVAHAIALGTEPVPTDWPGYLEPALPLIIASVLALIPAVIGLWLKLGDADGALGRVGIILAVVGYVAWLAALVAAATRLAYGPFTAAAATVAMVGTAALGAALVGRARVLLGTLLGAAALAGVAPPAVGWPAFAAAWTAVAVVVVADFVAASDARGGPRVAG
jgi:hypothetical protein